tara:strand:+ start:83 stop:292 length:210 start_codon:yes stop_codon:yes gene_type:complete
MLVKPCSSPCIVAPLGGAPPLTGPTQKLFPDDGGIIMPPSKEDGEAFRDTGDEEPLGGFHKGRLGSDRS